MKTNNVMMRSNFPLLGDVKRGKVRDIYDLYHFLLFVATDRISAFDVILPNGIPQKGPILTMISVLWLEAMEKIIPNHLIAYNPKDYPQVCQPYHEQLDGRSMIVKK